MDTFMQTMREYRDFYWLWRLSRKKVNFAESFIFPPTGVKKASGFLEDTKKPKTDNAENAFFLLLSVFPWVTHKMRLSIFLIKQSKKVEHISKQEADRESQAKCYNMSWKILHWIFSLVHFSPSL